MIWQYCPTITINNTISYSWSKTAINNVLTPTVEIMSHTKRHSQCYFIKSRDVKNKGISYVEVHSYPTHFLKGNFSQKGQIYEKLKLGPCN